MFCTIEVEGVAMRVVDSCVDTGAERNYTAIRTGEEGRREEGGWEREKEEKVGEMGQGSKMK